MKHAYLIMAHKCPKQLIKLLKLLDDSENDIYCHIDVKSQDISVDELSSVCKNAKLYFVKRISVKWGHWTIVECTYNLLKEAEKNGPYTSYHLLSGQDLPLKPIKQINDYFNNNVDKNFVEINEGAWVSKNIAERICKHFFDPFSKNRFIRYIQKVIKKNMTLFVEIFKVRKGFYRRGSAWWDISQRLVDIILEEEEWVYKTFNKYEFPDEAFVQTLIAKHNLFDTVGELKHYADWERSSNGSPWVFRKNDYDKLIDLKSFFARKFDETIDNEVIDMICKYVLDDSSKS